MGQKLFPHFSIETSVETLNCEIKFKKREKTKKLIVISDMHLIGNKLIQQTLMMIHHVWDQVGRNKMVYVGKFSDEDERVTIK